MNLRAVSLGEHLRPRLRVTEANRWHYLVGIHCFILGLYLATNHVHLFEPVMLHKSAVDLAVPFLPWSIWIYFSYYFSFVSVYLWEKDFAQLNKFVYAFLLLNVVSNLIFLLFPTTYDRGAFNLPEALDPLTIVAFNILHLLDSPANCLPSLHVASVFLAAFFWWRRNTRRFICYLLWACLVAASTLTTKQHYAYDIVGGFLLAALSYYVLFKGLPRWSHGKQARILPTHDV